jgi:two-component system, OmpR family, response regulator VicR
MPAASNRTANPGAAGKRILVVDDERVLLRYLRYALETNGFLVGVATDGQAAVDAAISGAFDLVLLDLSLPLLSGTDVCVAIRRKSDVPIIMLSAGHDDDEVIIGLELGADDYVAKPFSTDELLGRIAALLRRRQLSESKRRLADGLRAAEG